MMISTPRSLNRLCASSISFDAATMIEALERVLGSTYMMDQTLAVHQTSLRPVVVSRIISVQTLVPFGDRVGTKSVVELPPHKTALTIGHLVLHPLTVLRPFQK